MIVCLMILCSVFGRDVICVLIVSLILFVEIVDVIDSFGEVLLVMRLVIVVFVLFCVIIFKCVGLILELVRFLERLYISCMMILFIENCLFGVDFK